MNRSPTMKIGRDAEYPTAYVQQRFEQITFSHIEKGRYQGKHHPRLEHKSLPHGGAVQFRLYAGQPLHHAGQPRYVRRVIPLYLRPQGQKGGHEEKQQGFHIGRPALERRPILSGKELMIYLGRS